MPLTPAWIPAAGALPWRRRRVLWQIALSTDPATTTGHGPKAPEPGRNGRSPRVREVLEETGFPRAARPHLPSSDTPSADQSVTPTPKQCRYWAARLSVVTERHARDRRRHLLEVPEAFDPGLSYPRDHDQLRALEQADREGTLTRGPWSFSGNARSRSRSAWRTPTRFDRLNPRGREPPRR